MSLGIATGGLRSRRSEPVPLNDVIVDPENSSVLYVASDAGIYWSSDTGASWAPLGTGLPPIPVSDLHLDAGSRKLVAGTHGRSMYTFDLGAITVGVPGNDAGSSPMVRVSPNPFATRVTFALDRPSGARDAVAAVPRTPRIDQLAAVRNELLEQLADRELVEPKLARPQRLVEFIILPLLEVETVRRKIG